MAAMPVAGTDGRDPNATPERFRVVVPARYGSTRMPGKPLTPLLGRAMIEWVYRRACRSGARQVIVATDDQRIAEAARAFGAPTLMTAPTHRSGTDRIAEIARREGWDEAEIVVNVQGDEPLMPPALIRQVAGLLDAHPTADVGTLSAPLESAGALLDPHIVKVVSGAAGRALYFSRAPIPWVRDGAAQDPVGHRSHGGARRHVGIYAYRVGALLRIAALPASPLEQLEQLEQLRALENGMDIRVADALVAPGQDVNTAADVLLAEAALRREVGADA